MVGVELSTSSRLPPVPIIFTVNKLGDKPVPPPVLVSMPVADFTVIVGARAAKGAV